MRKILIINAVLSVFLIAGDSTFKLLDGTIINGVIETENVDNFLVKTKYGDITIQKSDLLLPEYHIKLKSGEVFQGQLVYETDLEVRIDSKLGSLILKQSDIVDMREGNNLKTKNASSELNDNNSYSKTGSMFNDFFNTKDKFILGEERLIDTFFDPTGYILEDGSMYLSGLSFGFGLSENLMVTSRWFDYIWGNFNIRPKYTILKKGNWERESSLAVGAHLHTYWRPNKVAWQSGKIAVPEDPNCVYDCVMSLDSSYFGGYFPLNSTITYAVGEKIEYDDHPISVDETDELDYMLEIFSAYTFSKARAGMRGRISSTIGAYIQMPAGIDYYPFRIFGSFDIDVTSKLKMVGEVFYDTYYLDINQRSIKEGPFSPHFTYQISSEEVVESDFNIRPIHVDFGFIYAVNESFRFGIHSQAPMFAFYWKF